MDDRQLWPDGRPRWERDVDALARQSLLVDPPADVQRSILAAVLQAAATHVPIVATPIPSAAGARSIPLAAYLLLAAVLVAYVAALSWLQGLFGSAGWVPALFTQILAVSDRLVGPLPTGEPLSLIWLLFQRAPWIALLPLGWLLWERDRAGARAA